MISTICSIISAISTIFIAIQLFQSARCEKKHHEEMRRIKTVEIMENWSKRKVKTFVNYATRIAVIHFKKSVLVAFQAILSSYPAHNYLNSDGILSDI